MIHELLGRIDSCTGIAREHAVCSLHGLDDHKEARIRLECLSSWLPGMLLSNVSVPLLAVIPYEGHVEATL